KPSVPEVYPQMMAVPIARRPLFPGFYKAITIRDSNVTAAIQEMMKRGQPYIGAFLFKDESVDKDIIENMDDVHDVGVFAQITSAFPVHGEENSLTAVLYPHRRIRMSALTPPNGNADESSKKPGYTTAADSDRVDTLVTKEEASQGGDIVASFEEGSVEGKDTSAQQYEPT